MSRQHLYIVDDDDVVRASLCSLAGTRPSVKVRDFSAGDSFLAVAPTLAAGCLLLDLHMPGTPGIEVLGRIAPWPARFATIILTGQADVPLAVQAMKLGAIDFLEKPCDPVALLGVVTRAFARLTEQEQEASRREQAQAKLGLLSGRELDVLRGLVDGLPNKLIAHQLEISPRTVEIYRANLMEKLDVRSLSEVLRITFAAGMDDEG
jgi:two-component system response regulator FixJ